MEPTPTTSPQLPVRYADFDCLPEALDYAARGRTGLNFYTAQGEVAGVFPYAELRAHAMALARKLIGAGLPPRARMVLVAETSREFMTAFMACQYAGVIPAPVALPTTLGGRDAYIEGLRRQLLDSGAAAAMAPAALLPFLRAAAAGLDLTLVGAPSDFDALPERAVDPRPFGAGDPSYLQYSSGSTRSPRGVDIAQRALMSNAAAIARHGLAIRTGDRCVSWLPLYHDMGLVGFFLVPLLSQASVDYLATRDFARRPLAWLDIMSRNGGTLAFSPSFGYELCARRARERGGNGLALDLGSWRGAGIGGDMIQPQVLARFADTFAAYGFRREAFVPSYGMAETTLALSFAPLGVGFEVDHVDRRRLADEHRAAAVSPADVPEARAFVLCGRPLPEHALEVRDDQGRVLPERHIGRVFARGPSLMTGYFNDPEATRLVLTPEGWLDTGDLGYRLGDQIVITGRSKDLIIVNGRNIWPQDLEWAVEELPGLRRGDACAFAVEGPDGADQVAILIQCRLTDAAERAKLVREVEAVVQQTAAVTCKVIPVPPHALPQTSSGKLSRSRAKANYLARQYDELTAAVPVLHGAPAATAALGGGP